MLLNCVSTQQQHFSLKNVSKFDVLLVILVSVGILGRQDELLRCFLFKIFQICSSFQSVRPNTNKSFSLKQELSKRLRFKSSQTIFFISKSLQNFLLWCFRWRCERKKCILQILQMRLKMLKLCQ